LGGVSYNRASAGQQVSPQLLCLGASGTSDDLWVLAYDGQARSGVNFAEFHVFV
jgi:hypothetical protein